MLPKHIAIIMDGNGRWAKKRGLPRKTGHVYGAKAVKAIVRHCNKIGIEVLTVYAFSTENWKRPKEEIESLMKLLSRYLDDMDLYVKDNVRVRFIGDISKLNRDLQDKMKLTERKCSGNTGMTFVIAVNYGARSEITRACRKLAGLAAEGKINPQKINDDNVQNALYTKGLTPVDLLIRTGGEYRISNFMLWQAAYAELMFMDNILWPDFKPKHLDMAIEEYQNRNRRFGGV